MYGRNPGHAVVEFGVGVVERPLAVPGKEHEPPVRGPAIEEAVLAAIQ